MVSLGFPFGWHKENWKRKWNNEPSYSRKQNNKDDNRNKQNNKMPNGWKNGEV